MAENRDTKVTPQEALLELATRKARNNLACFTLYTFPKFKMGWFHREVCRELDEFLADVVAGKSPRLILTAPPRHGKSQLVSREFPAYLLGRYPDMSVIACSYSSDLSTRMNRDVQRIMDSPAYHRLFDSYLAGREAVAATGDNGAYERTTKLLEIVGHQGSYRSAGVGNGITGTGCDILIVDDPFKDRKEAYSETVRDSVYGWYTSTASTRLSPGGGIIVMCTRWHPIKDDTPVLTTKGWKTHGELKPGDRVFGIDGKPVTVKAVTPPVWCDVAVDTGQERIICSKTHRWAVKSRPEHNAVVYEAGDLIGKKRIMPRIKPLDFSPRRELPIDPYWLGLWLGDGTAMAPEIKCGRKHTEHCMNTVYEVTRITPDSHGDLVMVYRHQGLRGKLVELNLLGNKHIPEIYKRASVNDRLQLLAGLIDTDGDHSRKLLRFANTNKTLLNDVIYLVRSLGMRANGIETVNRKGSKLEIAGTEYTRQADCYRFSFTPTMEIPTKIPYKRCEVSRGRERVAKFELAPETEQGWGRCISTTAPDGLYLVGRTLIPTHNTDDLVGRLLMQPHETPDGLPCRPWKLINYPAIAEHDEKYRKEGDALHPDRYPLSDLREKQATMPPSEWAALYQQRPIPAGGGVFKEDWINYYTTPPAEFDKIVLSWDMTFKDSDGSDYVVGAVWARAGGQFYLLDQVRGRWDFVTTMHQFIALSRKHKKAMRKLVEDKANGSAIIDTLKTQIPSIIPVTPTESKEARASAIATLWEAHNVFLPSPEIAPWIRSFTDELLSFPAGAHDDQVDAMTQALQDLQHGGRIILENILALRGR